MKLSTALVVLASAACASAASIRNPTAKKSLLSKARRLEDQGEQGQQGDDAAQDEEYSFLMNYSLKLIGCSAEKYQNPEDNEYEYSSVVVRMCPKDECDDEYAGGCNEGYGDYVVGINTFVESWLRDKEEDMQNDQDDQWDMNQFAECSEIEIDNDADEQQNGNTVYYMGPTCGDDGDIKMGFFSDYTCTTVPDSVTFEDISNGWTMPYEDGGLITNYCEGCAGYNDNGEYELSEMCGDIYESASSKCEGDMKYYSQYGKDDSGCEYIAEAFPSSVANGASNAGIVIFWIIIALLVVGGGFFLYTKWWMKRKQGTAGGLSSSDGVAA